MCGRERPTMRSRRSATGQRAIQNKIKELILARHLQTGDPIPTENELVEHLDVSRNSVREALKVLQALGIVEVRHGLGTYVGDGSLEALTDGLVFRGQRSLRGDRRDIRELVELRETLEAGLINQAIAVSTDDNLKRLHQRFLELEKVAGTGAAGDLADRAFHEQLYAPLANRLLSQLLAVFWDVYHDLSPELGTEQLDPESIIEDHRAIYLAMADRHAARATAAVIGHFSGIRRRLERLDAQRGAEQAD